MTAPLDLRAVEVRLKDYVGGFWRPDVEALLAELRAAREMAIGQSLVVKRAMGCGIGAPPWSPACGTGTMGDVSDPFCHDYRGSRRLRRSRRIA